jgi:hypothetical protein
MVLHRLLGTNWYVFVYYLSGFKWSGLLLLRTDRQTEEDIIEDRTYTST